MSIGFSFNCGWSSEEENWLVKKNDENIYPRVEVKLSRRILTTKGELDNCSCFNLRRKKKERDEKEMESIVYSFISIWLDIGSLFSSDIWSFDDDFLLRLAGRDVPSVELIYSSSSPPLINGFFNFTLNVDGDTVVIIGVSLIWINDAEELSFNVSVDKRL